MFLKKAANERTSAEKASTCISRADSTMDEVVDNWERIQLEAIEKRVKLLKSIFIDVNDDYMKKQLMQTQNKMDG